MCDGRPTMFSRHKLTATELSADAHKLQELQSFTMKGEAYCVALLERAGGDLAEAGKLYLDGFEPEM